MKFKLSTYLFAAGAMAGVFIAINEDALASERITKAATTAVSCCQQGTQTAGASVKKTSAPMACCSKTGATKTPSKVASTQGAMKCCTQAGKI